MEKIKKGQKLDEDDVVDSKPKIVAEMSEQRSKFLKEFAIKKNLKNSDFDQALKGKASIPNVVSLPKSLKRDNDNDTESLEENTKDSKKKNKKQRRA